MRNTIIKSILVLVMAFLALPMMGQNYLKIYFKDGHTERHYMHLVNNITMTRYDMEGNLHSDYQMQQIVMSDTTYSYYIDDIDSMTFKKVDEEQINNYVEIIRNVVTPIYEQCSTAEEMEEHLNEIKNIEGVEDVLCSGTEIIIKVRDWHDMVFMYPVVTEDGDISLTSDSKKIEDQTIKLQMQHLQEDVSKIKVAIAFQMIDDPRFKEQMNSLKHLTDQFNEMGFKAVFIPSKEGGDLDIDFYSRRMFEYDIVILDTHGFYNENSNIHGFLTGEYLGVSTPEIMFWNWVDEHLDKFGLYGIEPLKTDIDDAFIGYCRTGYFTSGVFIGVYEKRIGKNSLGFGDGYHIVFNGACSSLEGNSTLIRHDGKEFPGSDAVAQIFFHKGADIYMGYNNTCEESGHAAYNYYQWMLSGYSHETAFDHIPDYQKDQQEFEASLIDIFQTDSKRGLFILKTQTTEKPEQEVNEEYKKNKEIKLEGLTYSYYPTSIDFGFRVSKEQNVDQLESYQYQEFFSDNPNYVEGATDKQVAFSAVFNNPDPGETYYYRAFTFDGIHHNWGEEKHFTIKGFDNLSISTNSVSLNVGQTTTIDITSGSGSYIIECSDEHIATAFISGNIISVNALNVGVATITVSDKVSGQTASILVTVTGQADTRELMVTKTVNKTVFSIYKKTLDENDYRTNPDGWKCYRSELILDIIKEGKTESYVVDNNIYLDKQDSHHGGQQPCMLLDFNKNMIGIFCNPKGSGYNYEMDGYFYSSSMDNVNFSKETVFEGANWGWFPYFRDYGDDNIYLCNFSYGGYFTILAVRENGSWELYYDNDDISPEAAEQIWKRIGSVLVIGNTQDEDVDDRIHTVIPEEIRDEIEEYIPIYDGMNPPNIEDAYFLSPQILIGSSRSFDYIGSEYAYEYQKYSNQDMANNTIDMVRVQGDGIEWAKGSGAFISGTGNNFTIYFIMEGESDGIWTKEAYIVSGTKTASGIKDLTCGFILTEKGDDPDGRLVDVGTFRFFTDQDGMSETTSWPYGTQYGTRKRVKENSDRPNSHEKSHATLKHLKKP